MDVETTIVTQTQGELILTPRMMAKIFSHLVQNQCTFQNNTKNFTLHCIQIIELLLHFPSFTVFKNMSIVGV